jgi:hypothetical protein
VAPVSDAKIARSGSAATASRAHLQERSPRAFADGSVRAAKVTLKRLRFKQHPHFWDGDSRPRPEPRFNALFGESARCRTRKFWVLSGPWSVSRSEIGGFFERKPRVTPAQNNPSPGNATAINQAMSTGAQYHMVVTDLQHRIGEKGERSTFLLSVANRELRPTTTKARRNAGPGP